MLGFDRRIVLEDHLGVKHPVYLLDTVQGHLFVLLAPDAASRLAEMQAARADLESALLVLETAVMVMDVRSHRFLDPEELPAVLAGSRHHVLVVLGERLRRDGIPTGVPGDDELSAHAFAEECRRRATW